MDSLPAHSNSFSSSLRGDVVLRLTWLIYLAVTALACIAVFYSIVFMRGDFFAGALVLGGIAWLARHILRDRLAGLEAEMDGFGDEVEGRSKNEAADGERVGEVVALLKEWDGLEKSRGTAKFDPWALQSVRGEIRDAVRNDPELMRLFCPRE